MIKVLLNNILKFNLAKIAIPKTQTHAENLPLPLKRKKKKRFINKTARHIHSNLLKLSRGRVTKSSSHGTIKKIAAELIIIYL